ncbi:MULTISPECIES: EVE domain-containing protein [Prochlorococcus]|uniref:Uncharacterized conserved protein n=1 Tax=Prochlorococcus marinus (strain SARG / CCMP1375 / SS120) TaxID=167539 RepID=Q7VA84_PROMA|nr:MULTISPECIES: EVE domain-containing protein [Prochlorococcus]AAQ00625.1 Uncharacterized conserved protein [Prochlorococcus marinus subsp. marinus str. CCMP1375]KGG10881.1 hypothetical protein EV04_1844 [Prochlorococcus marinus str. LG]KGG20462.1 hypothetical protein EV08_1047 [Prochlorococcus marinus str. SS2]KGG24130.1 hypothetical protein EV09_0736 [Prochlorococcus marinus str. SS35]KGG31612.1 hypothetical protein EV10_1706 [Prochlorococcus marinus str. SS51]
MADKNISYWLMKSEPSAYGIKDLQNEKETLWDGIRNYQARNFMRSMQKGDLTFFYHSNCKPPGIVGLMEVIDTHLIDPTQFDSNSKYFDPKSDQKKPRWDCAKLKYIKTYNKILTLKEINEKFNSEELILIRKGNRLSIMPINRLIAQDLFKILDEG